MEIDLREYFHALVEIYANSKQEEIEEMAAKLVQIEENFNHSMNQIEVIQFIALGLAILAAAVCIWKFIRMNNIGKHRR